MNTLKPLEKKEKTEQKNSFIGTYDLYYGYDDHIENVEKCPLDDYPPAQKENKRYVVEMDMYMLATSDKKIRKLAEKLARKLDMKYDNNARVMSIHDVPFGSYGEARKVELT